MESQLWGNFPTIAKMLNFRVAFRTKYYKRGNFATLTVQPFLGTSLEGNSYSGDILARTRFGSACH